MNLCLMGRILDAISCEGVRFSSPLNTARADAFTDEGVAFYIAF